MNPEIILGPPGTGKTTRLLSLVEQELESGVAPDRIGYFSFTKKAAQEAVERACEKFGLEQKQLRFFRTLHSMCFQSLGMSNADVFEGKKMMEFGDWIGQKLSQHRRMDDTTMFGFTQGDRALFMENLSRVRCMPLRELYEQDTDGLSWLMVERMQRGLAEFKKKQNLVDYTDMLQMFADSEWSPPLEVLFVDEAQDLSMIQWRVVQKLARTARRVVIAGDDDQAIYRWAGAAVEHFVGLPGNVTILDQSWRVPPAVQQVSNEIISRVRTRRPKHWSPVDREGRVDRIHDTDEIDWWGDDILVLARNSFVFRDLEKQLRSEGVIFESRGHNSIKKSTLESVRLWESLRKGKFITADDARTVYESMSSGIGVKRGYKTLPGVPPDQPVDLQWLRDNGGLQRDEIWHEALDRIPKEESIYMLRALQKGERTTGRPRVRLSTIHGSKGGEARQVVLLRDMASRTFHEARAEPEDEARVWYVASTRAREQLSIVSPSSRMNYDI